MQGNPDITATMGTVLGGVRKNPDVIPKNAPSRGDDLDHI